MPSEITRRNRKGKFRLRPASPWSFDSLYIDVFSVAAALKNPRELFHSIAESGVKAKLVIDAWNETHMGLARRYLRLCEEYGLDCLLSEQKPAEIYAVELCEAECSGNCAVVTRDYDAALRANKCAVLLFQKGRFWAVEVMSSPSRTNLLM